MKQYRTSHVTRLLAMVMTYLLLAGCATQQPAPSIDHPVPGQFASTEDYFVKAGYEKIGSKMDQAGMPKQVQQDYLDCAWKALSARLTEGERTAMDNMFRGNGPAPDAEIDSAIKKIQAVNASLKVSVPATLQPYCPDQMAEFRPYMHG